jgi:two-component system chemotaxis response regulator CheB
MAEVKVVRRWASLAATAAPQPLLASGRMPQLARPARDGIELVAIGASTGGPVALKQLLLPLPASFPVPLVVVQHMSDGFLRGMADWLGAACALPVQIATAGTELLPGRVYLAPDGKHMRIAANRQLSLDAGAPVYGHRPAVSCLFASVAEQYGRHAIGILLTGMGKDGAAELKLMKEAGAITIAQDEASSAVHGMPGEAIRGGAASYVMSPEEIGAALPALVQR